MPTGSTPFGSLGDARRYRQHPGAAGRAELTAWRRAKLFASVPNAEDRSCRACPMALFRVRPVTAYHLGVSCRVRLFHSPRARSESVKEDKRRASLCASPLRMGLCPGNGHSEITHWAERRLTRRSSNTHTRSQRKKQAPGRLLTIDGLMFTNLDVEPRAFTIC